VAPYDRGMTTGPVDGTSDGDESLLVRAVRRRTGDRQATRASQASSFRLAITTSAPAAAKARTIPAPDRGCRR
jgi:hypothetical protein